MMANYEETRIDDGKRTHGLNEVDVSIQKAVELLEMSGNQQSYSFGAEITKTEMTTTNDTQNINLEIRTSSVSASAPEEEQLFDVMDVLQPSSSIDSTNLARADTIKLPSLTPAAAAASSIVVVDDEEDADGTEDDDEEEGSYVGRKGYLQDPSQESDDSSTDSDFSDLSGLSDISGKEWKPKNTRPINWVQKQIHSGANPRELLSQMLPNANALQLAPDLTDNTLWRLLASLLSEPPRRQKLPNVRTFEDAIALVQQSKNVIVLTGAGVSVSCGIPDFRSSDGIYSRLAKDYPNLPDPQAMFDINFFSRDPRPFYKFAREIYPGQFRPSPCHRFIKLLEKKQKLLRNYTQNIDTLEQVAGIQNVIECHGSFSTASCTKCKYQCDADAIRADIFAQCIPVCPRCQPDVKKSVDASEPVSEEELQQLVENGIMKPDIVFFGEGLPEKFHTVMASDKDKCDLLIVMGSSLKVRPVALIPSSIPPNVPQILINREQLHHLEFDVELLGDSDVIINQICHRLGDDWKEICYDGQVLSESKELLPLEEEESGVGGEAGAFGHAQLQDTDTQSVKSNASDIALQSAGTYSDSGFESSTSSGGIILGKAITASITNPLAEVAPIDQIKTSILEFSGGDQLLIGSAKNVIDDFMPPELLETTTDAAVDFNNPAEFQPFVERLGQESSSACASTTTSENYRHLSIDSTKDSGIQCDSSNSAAGGAGLLMPHLQHQRDLYASLPSTSAASTHINLTDVKKTNCDMGMGSLAPVGNGVIDGSPSSSSAAAVAAEIEAKRRQRKRKSAADRLIDGTFYCHENTSSYVFPGAQVSWTLDSEEEEDEDDDEEDEDSNCYEEDDIDNSAPLSPLLPPSLEAEMVSEIAANAVAAATVGLKRRSADISDPSPESESVTSTTTTSNETEPAAITSISSPPAVKRRRRSLTLDHALPVQGDESSPASDTALATAETVAAFVSSTAPSPQPPPTSTSV